MGELAGGGSVSVPVDLGDMQKITYKYCLITLVICPWELKALAICG